MGQKFEIVSDVSESVTRIPTLEGGEYANEAVILQSVCLGFGLIVPRLSVRFIFS